MILDLINTGSSNLYIGGPEIINKKDIYKLAFNAFKKKYILFNVPSFFKPTHPILTNRSKNKLCPTNQFYSAMSYKKNGEIYLNSFFNNEVKRTVLNIKK